MGHGAGVWGHRAGHRAVAGLSLVLCPVPPNPSPKGWYLMMPLGVGREERGLESCPEAPSPKGGFEG